MGDDEDGNPFKIITEYDLPELEATKYNLDITMNFLKDKILSRESRITPLLQE
jgi:hypothetical protein